MASLMSLFNRLLPFATPGTPLVQDLLHLAAICGALYFAPQIQEWYRSRQGSAADHDDGQIDQPETGVEGDAQEADQDDEERPDVDAHGGDDHVHHEIPAVNDDEQPPPDQGEGPGEAAQAGPARIPEASTQRNVGAKKAKSLARRDQRRAYNEFMRSEGEAQRAREAEGAAEREAALAAERERRRATEAALEAKKAKQREQAREQERREREEDIRRRDLAVNIVRDALEDRRMCDLFRVAKQVGGDVDEEWIERILRASGLIGRKGDVMTMITGMGWAVRVTAEDMARLYQTALDAKAGESNKKIGYEGLGGMLEAVLAER